MPGSALILPGVFIVLVQNLHCEVNRYGTPSCTGPHASLAFIECLVSLVNSLPLNKRVLEQIAMQEAIPRFQREDEEEQKEKDKCEAEQRRLWQQHLDAVEALKQSLAAALAEVVEVKKMLQDVTLQLDEVPQGPQDLKTWTPKPFLELLATETVDAGRRYF